MVKQLLQGVVEEMQSMHREALKDMLTSLTEKIVLDPASLECQIHYRIGIEGRNKLASPRLREAIPVLRAVSVTQVPKNR